MQLHYYLILFRNHFIFCLLLGLVIARMLLYLSRDAIFMWLVLQLNANAIWLFRNKPFFEKIILDPESKSVHDNRNDYNNNN